MAPVAFKAMYLFLTLVTFPLVLAAPSLPPGTTVKSQTLDLHNVNRIFYGAKNLVWDDKLAQLALIRGILCKNPGDWTSHHAESIAHGVDLTPINAVRSWADKSKTYNYQNPAYTEFTQMIWKGTEKVGCAWVNCPTGTFDKNKEHQIVVCEYEPRGNVPGQAAKNLGKKI